MVRLTGERGWGRNMKFLRHLKTAIELLRGNVNYRFAALLVRAGVSLALGPPVVAIIATQLLDVTFDRTGGWVDETVTLGPFVGGVLLIVCGVIFFLKRAQVLKLTDIFEVDFGAGFEFESAARLITERSGKAIEFSGFAPEELKSPIKSRQLKNSTRLEALGALGGLARGSANFPRYKVELGDKIVVRRQQ